MTIILCTSNFPTAALSGFMLNNGVIELKFDDSNKLVGWARGNSSNKPHSIQHSYLQYVERKGKDQINVCDGTNVYTFVPDNGTNTLTPKVKKGLRVPLLMKPDADDCFVEKEHFTVL